LSARALGVRGRASDRSDPIVVGDSAAAAVCRGVAAVGPGGGSPPARGRASRARAPREAHLASMNTFAISVRSASRFFACDRGAGAGRVVVGVVSGRRRGGHSRRVGDVRAARESRRASARLAAHRLGRRHVLRLRLRLHRAERFLEAVRLEVRLDGGHEVGGVRGHRRGGGGFPRRRAAKECAAGAAAGAARLRAEKRRRRRRQKKAHNQKNHLAPKQPLP